MLGETNILSISHQKKSLAFLFNVSTSIYRTSCILHMKHYSSLDALLYYKQRRPTTTSYKYNAHYLPFPFTIFFVAAILFLLFRSLIIYDMIIIFSMVHSEKKNTQDRASSVIILTESNIPEILFSTFFILVVL